ncbi:MAG: chromosomal replication initiator protein DnaA [Abditibacteriota bacterium]|nr:chromosomal replication initiator protein DnaA [Abditibacteriota bacterium]
MILDEEEVRVNMDRDKIEEAWQRTLELLGHMGLGEMIFSEIKAMKPELKPDGRIGLTPRNSSVFTVLRDNYFDQIREAFCKTLGYDAEVYLVQFIPGVSRAEKTVQRPAPKKKISSFNDMNLPLVDEFTFDRFVAGGNNRFALSCAQNVANEPSGKYNPLFIYGNSGLGKTHLMHAIGHEVYRKDPDARVFFTSGEAFAVMYLDFYSANKLTEFKKKIRNIDLLLLDDVQFLLGKEKTVEEFFLLFNALYESKKQIVLTSDRAPKDLKFDERLTSRFEWGVMADVKAPDLETRMAILQNKASREGMSFNLDVIEYVARLITGNVRLLTGALTTLIARSSLLGQSVTVDFAKSVLEDYSRNDSKKTVNVEGIIKLVAEEYGVSEEDIIGTSKVKEIIQARQTAMYITRETTNMSLPQIGRAFGGKDHTTVLHNYKKIEEQLEDKEFRRRVDKMLAKLLN